MLFIPQPSKNILIDFSQNLSKKIKTELKKAYIDPIIKAFLTDKKIDEILTDAPTNLVRHNTDLFNHIVPGFITNEYDTFIEIKSSLLVNRTAAQNIIYNKYEVTLQLNNIFDYEKFISSSKSTSYKLASVLDRNTCTYCNRLYTNTIIEKDPITKKFNDAGRITRPQFDHWFPKSKYPVLALSFFNLIPSCAVCNSSIKGDTPFTLATHIHPYLPDSTEEFLFTYKLKDVHQSNVSINFISGVKIKKTLEEFKINEVYNAHSNYELKDLLDLRHKYSDNYLDTLLNSTFNSLEVGMEEAYRLIFGVEIDESNFHKRPFSKFKKDILKELGVKL